MHISSKTAMNVCAEMKMEADFYQTRNLKQLMCLFAQKQCTPWVSLKCCNESACKVTGFFSFNVYSCASFIWLISHNAIIVTICLILFQPKQEF